MITLQENQRNINGIPITYLYKKGKYDCRHLVVIFSGFGLYGNYTYDFRGASLDNVPSHILWIKDSFFGNCCYYLCHKMDFSVEESVKDFIFKFCQEHFLDISNITLVGGSKGGSAALYFGIKYSFKNIISAAPQIHIGSFNTRVHKDVAAHMMRGEEDISILDHIFDQIIISTSNTEKNIYIFSSPVDQYETCIQIHSSLTKFKNFNHIITKSRCVEQHNQITSYNLPLILSLILAHGQGIHPRFGEWFYNGLSDPQPYSDIILQRQRSRKEVVAKLTSYSFSNDIFFPEGVAFLRGVPSPTYGLFKKTLIFERQGEPKTYTQILVGSTTSAKYSRNYYEEVYCDYLTAGFASMGKKGISLAELPIGRYRLSLRVAGKELSSEAPLQMKGEQTGAGKNHIYHLACEQGFAYLYILPVISQYRPDICKVTKYWIKAHTIHYEGYALRYGIEARDWADITVWLVLRNSNNNYIFRYGKTRNVTLNSKFDSCGVYTTSTFCSPGHKGIDVYTLDEGIYDVFITMQYANTLISECISKIKIDKNTVVEISKKSLN